MNQTPEQVSVPGWLREHYRLVDQGRLDDYCRDFTDDIEIRFGSNPPMRGLDSVRTALARGHERGMHHVFERVWTAGSTVIVEFTVTYTLADANEITLPVVSVIERRGELVSRLHVYIDMSPVTAAETAMQAAR